MDPEYFGVRKNVIIAERWQVGKFIRPGLFRSYYFEVTDLRRPIRSYTLKIESMSSTGPNEQPKFLPLEKSVLTAIKRRNGRNNIGLEWWGEESAYHYMITDTFGPNLNETKTAIEDERFTLRTVLHVARRSLFCIEELHYAGYIHRDIKPANMFIGTSPDELRQLFLGNFELCRRYVDDQDHLYPPREKADFRGSPRYASVNALREREQGRADDMWSWFFSVMELSVGSLPWDGSEIRESTFPKYIAALAVKKRRLMSDEDNFLHSFPPEYSIVLKHLRTLEFESKPDYALCLEVINVIMKRRQYTPNIPLDWEPKAAKIRRRHVSSRRRSKKSTLRTENDDNTTN